MVRIRVRVRFVVHTNLLNSKNPMAMPMAMAIA